jgi:hypothetical protein
VVLCGGKSWQADPAKLLELGVFGFGLLEDGDVGVGILPEGEEVPIGGAGFRSVASQFKGTAQAETRQSTYRVIHDDAAMVSDFLEFRGGFAALM